MENGKTYQTRSGVKVTIINTNGFDNSFPIVGIDEKRKLYKFTRSGSYIGDGFPHQFDLVKDMHEDT